MTALPGALAPWASELSMFPDDVGLALGQLASRLAVAIGPMSREARSHSGEPDGFDGVVRRGSYNHLLASEWAIADAVPEEFMRRASAGELAFLHVRRRQTAAARLALALFDAGPSQIGGPRIVQLATLIVLSQRARASRIRFRWGIVQRPADGWVENVTAATVRRLLGARTAALPGPEALRAWATKATEDGAVGEVWLVGSASLGAFASEQRSTVVAIEDPLQPGERKLEVTCTRFRRPDARVILELPEGRMCSRLLRDPFEVATAFPVQSTLGQNPRLTFSVGARKVIVKRADGKMSLFTVPNSPAASGSRITTFAPPDGETPIATDWQAGRWRILTQREGTLVLHTIAKGGGAVRPPLIAEVVRPLPAPDPAGGLAALVRRRDGVECFVHPAGIGVEVRGTRVYLVGVAKAVARAGSDVLWVREDEGRRWLERNGNRQELDRSGEGDAIFGWQGPSAEDWLLAMRVQATTWKFYSEKTAVTLAAPPQTRVIGITNSPGLILCESDGRSVTLFGLHFTSKLPPLSGPLVDGCVSSSAPYVAYASESGELIVYSLQRQATVLHVLPDAERSS